MGSEALIIIDLQNCCFDATGLTPLREELVTKVNRLVKGARSNKVPVIWITEAMSDDLSDVPLRVRRSKEPPHTQSSKAAQLLPELDYEPTDFRMFKTLPSAFLKTDLEKRLRELNVEFVMLAGVNADVCILATALDGYQRDFEMLVLADCVGCANPAQKRMVLSYMSQWMAKIGDSDTVLKTWNS